MRLGWTMPDTGAQRSTKLEYIGKCFKIHYFDAWDQPYIDDHGTTGEIDGTALEGPRPETLEDKPMARGREASRVLDVRREAHYLHEMPSFPGKDADEAPHGRRKVAPSNHSSKPEP